MDLQLNKDEDAEYGNDNNGTTTNDTPVYLNPTEGEGDGNDADNHNNANTDLPDHSNNKPPPHLADDPATGPGKRLKTGMLYSRHFHSIV